MHAVLVLGGTGMLGGMLVRILSECPDLKVASTCRTAADAKGIHYFEAENSIDELAAILDRYGPFAYVINCIGILKHNIAEDDSSSVQRAIRLNALFPHQLAAVTRTRRCRVVHVSTDAVFSGASAVTLFEDTPTDCVDVYGQTKRLGEVVADHFVTFRCSIVGPDPLKRQGILEWFLAQPDGATVDGYTDHLWNGITTLQFARLCEKLILAGGFDALRDEAPIHHLCPNSPLSKYDLVKSLGSIFNRRINVRPVSAAAGSLSRVLATRYRSLPALMGSNLDIKESLAEIRDLQFCD